MGSVVSLTNSDSTSSPSIFLSSPSASNEQAVKTSSRNKHDVEYDADSVFEFDNDDSDNGDDDNSFLQSVLAVEQQEDDDDNGGDDSYLQSMIGLDQQDDDGEEDGNGIVNFSEESAESQGIIIILYITTILISYNLI